ncbi:MAG: DUF4159 domain-containing protein [Candidatus Latescibacterota bacterium]
MPPHMQRDPVPPGLLRPMVGASLLLHAALLALLLVGVRLHVRSQPPSEPRVTVRFDKAARPQRPALERSRRAGPVSRPLVRVAGRVRQPQAGAVSAGPGSRGSGGGAGGGSGEGLGMGAGGGVSGPWVDGRFPSGGGLGPLCTPGIGTGGGGVGGLGLAGVRAGTEEVDLGVELLGVEALDTGRHPALVVVAPHDPRRLKGYLHLGRVTSDGLERAEVGSPFPRRGNRVPRGVAEAQALQGLSDCMNSQTHVRADVRDAVTLDDPALLEIPFLLLTANDPFEFTAAEARNLGRYLTGGGFVWAEVTCVPRPGGNGYSSDLPGLRALVRAALGAAGWREGKDWRFVRLPPEHPLFHCLFDLPTLPMGFWDTTQGAFFTWGKEFVWSPPYLEGIELGRSLVGVYSQKDYCDYWGGAGERLGRTEAWGMPSRVETGAEGIPVYRLGVNVLVYALTRDGGLAQKLVAAQ